jgi:hypothetical protein
VDAGYKSSVNAYMVYQSFVVDVDEANSYVQALLRDDDADNEIDPMGTRDEQLQTKILLQKESEFTGAAGATFTGTCLRSSALGGDERVSLGTLGERNPGNGYVPGFHYEAKAGAAGRYVLHVFRTCSSRVGECDATNRDGAGKSFQFTMQAQVVKRGTLQWQALRDETASDDAATPAPVQKRGHGGAMVAVGDRYVVGVGGPLGDGVGGAAVPMTVFDTTDDKEYTMAANADLDALDFPSAVASIDPLAKSFYVTGGKRASGDTTDAFNVYLVTITHTAGFVPTVAVSREYVYAAGTVSSSFAPRWGAAAVAHGNKIFIQGGFHMRDHARINEATACAFDATDQVWGFDVALKRWDDAAFASAPERPAGGCSESSAGNGRGRHAAVVVGGRNLRISGGFRRDADSVPIGDQWSLDLTNKTWTQLAQAAWAMETTNSALTRSDHALVVLGESLVVMAGGTCGQPDTCDAAYALTQPSGGRGVTLDDHIALALGPANIVYPIGTGAAAGLVSNKAVLVGVHLYLFALGDPSLIGTRTQAGTKTGSIWKYKIASHVAPGVAGTDSNSNSAPRGAMSDAYKTLSYAVNRGEAPVVVLMTGNHRGDGNADAMLAGPAIDHSRDNKICAATITPATSVGIAGTMRETCVGPLVVTGQSGAILRGEDLRPGVTVSGAISVFLHGFMITGGKSKFGGALYLDALRWGPSKTGAHVFVQGMTLANSVAKYAGGCVYAARLMTVYDSIISGCAASTFGAGIYAHTFTETMLLDNVVIQGGSARNLGLRGGLIFSSVKLRITNSALSGGYAGSGGGLYLTTVNSAPTYFTNSSMADCTAQTTGGGFYVAENDLQSLGFTTAGDAVGVVMTSATVSGCQARSGAGVFLTRGQMTITGSVLRDNSARVQGGALTMTAAKMTMTDTIVERCSATSDGGGISATLSRMEISRGSFTQCTSLRGAAMRVRDSRQSAGSNVVRIVGTSFSRCTGGASGAIHVSDVDLTMDQCTVQAGAGAKAVQSKSPVSTRFITRVIAVLVCCHV